MHRAGERSKLRAEEGSPRERRLPPCGCGSCFRLTLRWVGAARCRLGYGCWRLEIHHHRCLVWGSRGSARTSRTSGYVSELEGPTPANARGVVEAKVVRITHAACQQKSANGSFSRRGRGMDSRRTRTHLVTTPVIQGLRPRMLGVIHSALARRTKKRW